MARLKDRYEEEIRPSLVRRFGYSTPMQAPRIQKVTLNMGVGEAKQDSRMLEAATDQLATIAGQRPNVRRARKSIAQFKVREGMPVGVSVTLRGARAHEFLDRLMSIAIPRIRDFRGLSPGSFDGRGNYSLGVREQIIFPEIDYDAIDQVRGLDITITTSAQSDEEAFALLDELGMPFAREARPAGGQAPDTAVAGRRDRAGASQVPEEQAADAPAAEPTPVEEKAAAEQQAIEATGAAESPTPGRGASLPGEADPAAANAEAPVESAGGEGAADVPDHDATTEEA
jgi:large subunit ribosomal protein L5